MNKPVADKQSRAERIYQITRNMAIAFQFKPGERINEVSLAEQLDTSRTPLREALNRLVSEEFLRTEHGRGFFCRDLRPRDIFELYQFRTVIESAAARIACEQCTDQALEELMQHVEAMDFCQANMSIEEAVKLDESFHEQLVTLARNQQMLTTLLNINARIRFVRWIDMQNKTQRTQADYKSIVLAMIERHPDQVVSLITSHIERRSDEIFAAVRQGKAQLDNIQTTQLN